MKILFKFPSRGRPDRFFESLDTIVNNMQDVDSYHVACSLDLDDPTMCNSEVETRLSSYGEKVSVQWGYSKSKVDAINRDLPDYGDIIVVMSDDMLIRFYGFDTVIRDQFKSHGLDILCHIPDNDAGSALATMYIAGRGFYNRFEYIYNPIYKSLFCDNAIMEVAKKLGCYRYLNFTGLIFHANGAYGHREKDAMFLAQQEIGWTEDQKTYEEDKKRNFGL